MKKTLLSTAILAAMATSSAFAAATVTGEIQLGLVNQTELDMDGSTLNIGIAMEEDMGNGLTGFMSFNFANDAADVNGGGFANDESYIGVKGDFGTITLGNQPDAAGFACGATDIFNYNGAAACGAGAYNDSLDNALTYVKSINALTFVVGMTFDGSNTGTEPVAGDHTLLAVNFAGEGFSVGAQMTSPDSNSAVDDMFVIGGSMTFNEIVVGLTLGDNGTDNAIGLAVTVPMAGGELVAAIDTGDAIVDETNIGFHKSLSENMYAGVEFTTWDSNAVDDMIGAYLGMTF